MIKPIPTQYRGYQFRSRLEARWAIFFDEMGIPFSYENEGYEIASGTWYLPDFRLKDCYVEIKHKFDNDKEAPEKMGALVAGLRVPGVIVYGDPLDHLGVLFEPHFLKPGYVRTVASFLSLQNSLAAATKSRMESFSYAPTTS